MKKVILAAVILVIAALFIGGVSAADSIGGDQGKIIIKSNANGASVVLYSINGDPAYTGTIANGEAEFYVYSTATPLKTAVVYGDGWEPGYSPIQTPAAGKVLTYTINLEAIPHTGTIGGDFGFIQVVTNVVGANVELHTASSTVQTGVTDEHGVYTFEVKTTGTPVKYVFVSANGYEHNSVNVVPPQAGKTEVVNVVLTPTYNPTVTPTPTETETTPAASPLGAAVGVLGVLGAAFLLRKE